MHSPVISYTHFHRNLRLTSVFTKEHQSIFNIHELRRWGPDLTVKNVGGQMRFGFRCSSL